MIGIAQAMPIRATRTYGGASKLKIKGRCERVISMLSMAAIMHLHCDSRSVITGCKLYNDASGIGITVS